MELSINNNMFNTFYIFCSEIFSVKCFSYIWMRQYKAINTGKNVVSAVIPLTNIFWILMLLAQYPAHSKCSNLCNHINILNKGNVKLGTYVKVFWGQSNNK